MGRRSNTILRKQEIIKALLAVMAEHGYEKATVQLIAKEAGLAPGLVHYHFKTKLEILVSLIHWITAAAKARLDNLTNKATSPWSRLEAFINARLATGKNAMPQVVAAWVVIAGESVRQKEIRNIYQGLMAQQFKDIKYLVSDVWEGKTSNCKEVAALSAILLSAIEGAYLLSATAPKVMPKGYAADMVLDIVNNKIPLDARCSA